MIIESSICQEQQILLKNNIKIKKLLKSKGLSYIHKSVNYPKYKVSIFKNY